MDSLHTHLQNIFGFREFRPHQEPVIRAIVAGRDSFTIMPTGAGKSLCYQLPARIQDGVCVVVSPLISLMKDQVDAARANGLAAATLNSTSLAGQRNAVWQGLHNRSLDLLYVSPERLCIPEFLQALKNVCLSFFAIDEAHCISSWGHDFRPDYLGLSVLSREFPATPLAAFTATATARVTEDIITRLNLRDPLYTKASFNRPNLSYQVTPRTDLDDQLLPFLREHAGESGIIYHTTRKDVERTTAFLCKQGFTAQAYHAGLPDAQRSAAQEAFRADTCPIIVATIAFGMGIDKPNVRFVIHADLPKNLEGYYQETGRAGRDGDAAQCLLLYSRKDIARLMSFTKAIADEQMRGAAQQQLWRMLEFTQNDSCRRKALLAYFGEHLPGDNCGGCDICTGEAEREDATIPAQKLLSAMVRTGCRFGARHVISVVTGKETDRICSLGHHLLPTFGVGKDETTRYWRGLMDVLLAQGLVSVADAYLPVPVVTEAGWQVLRGQKTVSTLRQAAKSKKTRSHDDATVASPRLFERLREERTRLARQSSVPPYVVFSDRTLREMSRLMPDTPEALLAVPGVGQHKLATYGEVFLGVVRAYREEHPEECDVAAVTDTKDGKAFVEIKSGKAVVGMKSGKAAKGDSWRETGRMLDGGMDIVAICEARELKVSTILTHLEHLAEEGVLYPPERFISLERLEALRGLFADTQGWVLGPVVELAKERGEACSYEEARIARLFLSSGGMAPGGAVEGGMPSF